jgi:pimeloyl-ACP methyl ester carboxylesterase
MWNPQWEALCARFTAIRYDARAFGESDDPGADFAPHEDARAVMAAAGFDSAAVMGVSMGGATALNLAIDHPECVRALVAVSTTPHGTEPPADFAAEYGRIEAMIDAEEFEDANEAEVRAWVDGPGQPAERVDPSVRSRLAKSNLELLRRQSPLKAEMRYPEPPASERLGDVTCPTLVVTGALDQPLVHSGSRALVEATGARQVEFARAAHFPNLESPLEFLGVVIPFLEEHAGSS